MSTPPGPASYPDRRPGEPAGTLILAIHGVLRLDDWVHAPFEDGNLEEDAFSLVVKRTVAYGLGSFIGEAPTSAQWGHNDAGGDWTQDGGVRQLAWLQVAVPRASEQRVPVEPAALVLDDVLHRIGQFELTGIHTVVPMDLATDGRAALVYAAGWFALGDPASVRTFIVTLYAEPSARLADSGSTVLAAAQQLAPDVLVIEWAEPGSDRGRGLRQPLVGEQQTAGMVAALTYRCTAREWSLDIATWATELFIEALRATGTRSPTLITVSIA